MTLFCFPGLVRALVFPQIALTLLMFEPSTTKERETEIISVVLATNQQTSSALVPQNSQNLVRSRTVVKQENSDL